MAKTSRIGLVGVGMMGSGIAASVQRAGYPLRFLERPGNQRTDALIAGGATSHASLAELAGESDVLILCVTGAPQVEGIIAEALPAIRSGMMVIDCSTSLPETSKSVAAQLSAKGASFIDSPMTRTPKEAAAGRLGLIVGGDKETFEAALSILETFGESITHAGPVGAGHAAKLLHNYVSLGFSAVLAEAAACAAKSGIETGAFMDVLAAGGGKGVILDRMRPYIESGDGSSFRFALANADKDFGYYTGMAESASAAHTVADTIAQVYADASAAFPEGTVPELLDHLKR